jgi:signal transduction histidine kinase
MKRTKIRLEAKIVFVILILMLAIIALVVIKGTYKDLGIETWQLWTFAGILLFIYIMYLKFRTQTVQRFIIDEKIKTHSLLDSLPQPVVILDEEGKIVTANPKAVDLLGIHPIDSIGLNFAEVFTETKKSLETSYGRFLVEIKKTSTRCSVTFTPISGTKGRIAVLEPEVSQSQETTARQIAKRDYSEFFTNIYAAARELQKEHENMSGEGKKNLARLLVMARKALNIPTKVEQEIGTISKTNIDLEKCVKETFHTLAPLAQAKEIKTIVETRGEKALINADPKLLKRVFEEIIFNAISYSNEGGLVNVSIEPTLGDVTVSIRDSGIGISQEEFSKIFDDGYVGAEQFVETRFGRGVGLYLARRIIEAHGGSIWIESKKGLGTRVSFNLPR